MKDINEFDDPEFLKELYKQLFSNSSDPLFICDRDFKFTECNKAFDELFQKEDVCSKREFLVDLFEKEGTLEVVLDTLRDEGVLDDHEVILRNYEDERIHALLSIIEIKNLKGSVIGYQGIVHDETERVLMHRKLGRAQKIAFTGRMVRTIAHEIRNPLTNVSLAVASLKEGETSEDDRMMLDIIENNGSRINELITELLNSSRQTELELTENLLQELVTEALELAEDRLELQNIELKCQFSEEPIMIQADLHKAKLAFNNIFINAIEAMESNGTLTLTIKRASKRAHVTISDTGMGMESEVIEHLFDPFFTTKPNGTGMGMTTVQNIFDSHGWNFEVESEVGVGSSFHITMDLSSSLDNLTVQ